MEGNDLIENRSDISCLSFFNEEFRSKIEELCPLLKQFTIYIVNKNDSKFTNDAHLDDNDAFGFYLVKDQAPISSTYVEIIVDKKICQKLNLTQSEMMAAIAHEIGHVIKFFRVDAEDLQGLEEEVCCDMYACRIGLATPLYSLLCKLIDSNLYNQEQSAMIKNRLLSIKNSICNNDNVISM